MLIKDGRGQGRFTKPKSNHSSGRNLGVILYTGISLSSLSGKGLDKVSVFKRVTPVKSAGKGWKGPRTGYPAQKQPL